MFKSSYLFLASFAFLGLVAEAAELRVRRAAARAEERPGRMLLTSYRLFLAVPSGAGTLISKIATALLLPLTFTSPSGRMSYASSAGAGGVAHDNPGLVILVQAIRAATRGSRCRRSRCSS